MNNLLSFLNKNWLKVLVVFAVVGLIVTIVLRLITPAAPVIPKTEFISTNQSGGVTDFSGINFTGSYTSVVTALAPAAVSPSQTTLDYIKNQLIENYQLAQVIGSPSLWTSDRYTLSYNEASDTYLFYTKTEPPKDVLLTSTNQGIETAKIFVSEAFPNLALTPQIDAIQYFGGGGEYEPTDRENANFMEIPFTYTIDGVPIYIGHEATAPVTVVVNNQLAVHKVRFQTSFFEFTPSELKLPLVSLATALENINTNNEASIISAYDESVGSFTLDQIKSGELKTVLLEYRVDLDAGLAYPFYRFAGELTNQDGQVIQAEIITPAVVTK